MHFSKKLFFGCVLLSTATSLFAARPCGAHTWHNIFATNGNWNASLQVINETNHAWLVGANCEKVNSLSIATDQSASYGFMFDHQADFDVAYTVTVTQTKGVSSSNSVTPNFMGTKACVYVVTAKGPAQPDIRPVSFNNAKCDWKVVHGVGEDFFVS